jgi:hypothetical protein
VSNPRAKNAADNPMPWRRWVAFAAGALIGLLLVFAGVAKAIELENFAAAIEDLRLGSFHLVPQGWGWALGILAILVEIVLGTALLMGQRTLPVLAATAALLVFFLGVTALQMIAGTSAGCGCFGSIVERTPRQEFLSLLVYLAILAPAFLARPAGRSLTYARGLVIGCATGAGLVLSVASSWLPSHSLAYAAGRILPFNSVPERDPRATLDEELPELWSGSGPQVVVMTSFAEGPALSEDSVARLNELAAGYELTVPVWILVSSQSAESGEAGGTHEASSEDETPPEDAEYTRYYELFWSRGLDLTDPQTGSPAFRLTDERKLQYYSAQWSLRGRLDPDAPVTARMVRAPAEFLPRAFWIEDGHVLRVWDGIPSVSELNAAAVTGEVLP